MALVHAFKRAIKKRNQAARNWAGYAVYEVIEKSRVHDNDAYCYKALIRVKNTANIDLKIIAAEIQRSMGYDPYAYLIYDVHGCTQNGIVELTWKSWDSCD